MIEIEVLVRYGVLLKIFFNLHKKGELWGISLYVFVYEILKSCYNGLKYSETPKKCTFLSYNTKKKKMLEQ